MTKARNTTRPAPEAIQPEVDAGTARAMVKPPRGKAASGKSVSTTASPKDTLTEDSNPTASNAAPPKPPRQTKAALLRARLSEPGGVSIAALIAATGWQAHTLRAAFSGLRKEGLVLTRRREGEDTVYAIAAGGSAAAGVPEDSASSIASAAGAEAPSGEGTDIAEHSDRVIDPDPAALADASNA